jgi:four helix bundle protein
MRLGDQLIRSATSVGANYRAACRAKSPSESPSDFVNKLRIVEEECDESIYWLELMIEAGLIPGNRVEDLMAEGKQILAIIVASAKTARGNSLAVKRTRSLTIVNRQS